MDTLGDDYILIPQDFGMIRGTFRAFKISPLNKDV